MLSKRYESTEVDRRTWLHVPSGIHHFKYDKINNMDHICISGNEHSSVILGQTCRLKRWK